MFRPPRPVIGVFTVRLITPTLNENQQTCYPVLLILFLIGTFDSRIRGLMCPKFAQEIEVDKSIQDLPKVINLKISVNCQQDCVLNNIAVVPLFSPSAPPPPPSPHPDGIQSYQQNGCGFNFVSIKIVCVAELGSDYQRQSAL